MREKVASGGYRDEQDVIERALMLLDWRDKMKTTALDEGDINPREGSFTDIGSEEELEAFSPIYEAMSLGIHLSAG